jgi:transcriptional regulator with XRE-family HTH domain
LKQNKLFPDRQEKRIKTCRSLKKYTTKKEERMNLIKKYRILRGLTQAELGAKTGLDAARICLYENGERIPEKHLASLKKALEIPREEFVHLITAQREKKKTGRKSDRGITTWVRLPPDLRAKLELEAEEKGVSLSQIILSKLA